MFETSRLKLLEIGGRYAVCRLQADAGIPPWLDGRSFQSVTRTEDELSILTSAAGVPDEVDAERDFSGFRIAGTLAFSQTGILAEVTRVLADAEIPVFVVSTFDTDYLFVRHSDLAAAAGALGEAGHEFVKL